MKKATLIIMIICFTFGLFGSVLAEPAMTIPESVYDFGYVPQHSKISHIFWLHSTGTDSLKILTVKPG
ncbi:MAG: DUF1573 domain-containing protein [candidate division Zixibacteria bacterium]|nr:DUF1573 domain-containing protein [candidate division Zixibacteria bacterium]